MPRTNGRRRRAWGSAALLLSTVSCSRAEPAPNFLILAIDALRPDHMSAYGYRRDTTPTLERLAGEGVPFEDATSPSSYTLASVASIFSGTYPSAHGVYRQSRTDSHALDDSFRTIAESLREHGYATAAFMPNPSLKRQFGFDQGFDEYRDDVLFWRRRRSRAEQFETARRIQRLALEWLDRNTGRKFFLYLHYRDVHGPYLPPPPYDRLYWKDGSPVEGPATRPILPEERAVLPQFLRLEPDHGVLDYYLAQYDGEIRYTDDHIGVFLGELDRRGVLDRTVIFVTADHGESFLDHGTWGHGSGLYQEEIHVPLILVDPQRGKRGARIDAPVETIDIYPTILDRLGLPIPKAVQGQSLLPLIGGERLDREPVFSEGKVRGGRLLAAVRRGSWKLILDRDDGGVELYDLASDPKERRDLSTREKEKVRELRARLERFLEKNERIRRTVGTPRETLDERTVEQLKALGYLE